MKNSITILIAVSVFVLFSSFKTNREKVTAAPVVNNMDYNQLNAVLFDWQNDTKIISTVRERVIIMNMKGESIREDYIEGDNMLSSSVLTPLIQKSDLVMKIDHTFYYLLSSR